MKLVLEFLLAAMIAVLHVDHSDAAKAGLRQLSRGIKDGEGGGVDVANNNNNNNNNALKDHGVRTLNSTPECEICKDMYDTLKESTSVLSCEATCDSMAEMLGGGPEDPLADMVMATCDPLCEIILDGSTAGESPGSACSYVGLC